MASNAETQSLSTLDVTDPPSPQLYGTGTSSPEPPLVAGAAGQGTHRPQDHYLYASAGLDC